MWEALVGCMKKKPTASSDTLQTFLFLDQLHPTIITTEVYSTPELYSMRIQ
jgi:hypothetical protein